MAHKILLQIAETDAFKIMKYVYKNGILPSEHINLAPVLKKMNIIKNFQEHGVIEDRSVAAELSENYLLCQDYYQAINKGNTLMRFLCIIILDIFYRKKINNVHEQCQKLEKELSNHL